MAQPLFSPLSRERSRICETHPAGWGSDPPPEALHLAVPIPWGLPSVLRPLESSEDLQDLRRRLEAAEQERDRSSRDLAEVLRERDRLRARVEDLEREQERATLEVERLVRQRLELEERTRASLDLERRVADLEERRRRVLAILTGEVAPPAEETPSAEPMGELARDLTGILGRQGGRLVDRVMARVRAGRVPMASDPEAEGLQALSRVALRLAGDGARDRVEEALERARHRLNGERPAAVEPPSEGGPSPSLEAGLERARTLAGEDRPEAALEVLRELQRRFPGRFEPLQEEVDLLAATGCWREARESLLRLDPAAMSADGRARLRDARTRITEELVAQVSPEERKGLLVELAELHQDEPSRAVPYLVRARALAEPHPRDGWIDLQLTRAGHGTPEERRRGLRRWMNRLVDPEVFRHVGEVFSLPGLEGCAPVGRWLVALGTGSRKSAHLREDSREFRRVVPPRPRPQKMLEMHHDPREGEVIRNLLHLLPSSGIRLDLPAPEEQDLAASARPMPWRSRTGRLLEGLRRDLVPTLDVEIRQMEGSGHGLLRVVPGEKPMLLVSPDLDGPDEGEARFLGARAFFGLVRGHDALRALARVPRARLAPGLLWAALDGTGLSWVEVAADLDLDAGDPARSDWSEVARRIRLRGDRTRLPLLAEVAKVVESPDWFLPVLERAADQFAARLAGYTSASYAVAREALGSGEPLDQVAREGFRVLYRDPENEALCLRLQRMWVGALLEVE